MKKSLFLLLFAFCVICKSQNVTIPDANFKAYLVGNSAINTNHDSEIQVSEANAFTGTIFCAGTFTISSLTGIEAFTKITQLNCSANQLTSLDLSKNIALTSLTCNANQLTSLDVSKNTALTSLYCHDNKLTSLDVSKNTALTSLYFQDNKLTSLDVSKNTALISLQCYSNLLTSLDVSKNTALIELYCFSNQLASLDVSKNTALTVLFCLSNQLASLNLKNGNNGAIMTMNATSNPNLTCIQVDNPTAAHTGWTKDATASYKIDCGPVVYIPNANFKAYLVGNTSINTNGDAEIQVSEATAFTGIIDCSSKSITNLTGIEAFTKIKQLYCNGNQLTSLDLSKNTALTTLWCFSNQLTSLDLSKNTALTDLYCQDNQLTSLDVTKSTALTTLWCFSNQLTSLDVSKNTALTNLYCQENQLTSLDVSKNTAFTTLSCFSNQLTSLDLSKNTALTVLYSQSNLLTSLDVSKNTALTGLYCFSNQLTSLNLKNGNNGAITSLNVTSNSNLTCIQVDNATAAHTGWAKDATASYNTDCRPIVYIPNAIFKAYLVGNTSINTDGDAEIQVSEATAFTGTIGCNNKSITSLTGIEAFTKITNLFCQANQLTSLDLSKNTALTQLHCYSNQLTSLDLSKNTALTYLSCYSNQLTSLDLSKNTALTQLYCYSNQLTSLDLSKNTALTYVSCYSNQLTSMDISKNIGLNTLQCQSNKLTSLDVSKNTALTSLYCDSNQLTSLDVSKNTALISLYSDSNQLTSLDVSKNTSLSFFYCQSNKLTSLNLKNGNNNALGFMNATSNPNLTCIQVDNATATHSGWSKDATASYKTDCSATLGIDDINNTEVHIYPNPTKAILNFTQKANAKVYNSLGQKVAEQKQATSLNMSKLPSGIYIVVLSDDSGKEILKSKVIKE